MSERIEEAADTDAGDAPARFVGEEGHDDRSTPRKDLVAALVIGTFALAASYFALQMPVHGSVLTAPGLLPFLVGVSLFAMALGLGVKAVRTGGALRPPAQPVAAPDADVHDGKWVAFLVVMIVVYVVAVDWVTFDLEIPTPLFRISVSSYEVVSTVVLTILLKAFWRAALLRCVIVSAVWSVALAAVFRYGFQILLPGSA